MQEQLLIEMAQKFNEIVTNAIETLKQDMVTKEEMIKGLRSELGGMVTKEEMKELRGELGGMVTRTSMELKDELGGMLAKANNELKEDTRKIKTELHDYKVSTDTRFSFFEMLPKMGDGAFYKSMGTVAGSHGFVGTKNDRRKPNPFAR